MARISKKNLLPMLIAEGFIPDIKSVSFEAYGRNVQAYIHVQNMPERLRLERLLKTQDISFNPRYWPGQPVVEVGVTYFKAWHWDE